MWRSIAEREGDAAFRAWLDGEFPNDATQGLSGLSRREFLKVSAASLALAGLAGCRPQPPEDIVPALRAERGYAQGKPEYFTTALACGPEVLGVVVQSHMGRPIKIEGNPAHPASGGATSAFTQAEILTLYDPDRGQAVYFGDQISTWSNFRDALGKRLDSLRQRGGAGLYVVTPPLVSPALRDQMRLLLSRFPQARWYVHDPLHAAGALAGAAHVFGRTTTPLLHVERADAIVAFDCDFLFAEPGAVRHAREFAARRRDHSPNRLYVAEPCPTVTGCQADHRLPIRSADVMFLAWAVAAELGVLPDGIEILARVGEGGRKWAKAVARDLADHRGKALVVAGRAQPAATHALCWAINHHLECLGQTVEFIAPDAEPEPGLLGLTELGEHLDAGRVDTLLLVETNPAYDAPADLRMAERMGRAAFSVHAGLFRDETARRCTWHAPLAHALESWSDVASADGTVSLIQPLIRPLYAGRTIHELLAIINEEVDEAALATVRGRWESQHEGDSGNFENWWQEALRTGVIEDARRATAAPEFDGARLADVVAEAARAAGSPATADALELRFAPSNAVWDGRYANNAWLQELPDPVTKLCWGNAALVSPTSAKLLGVGNGQLVEWTFEGRSLQAPVWIVPGHAEHCVTLPLGYGRDAAGRVGNKVGYNAYALRTTAAPWFAAGLRANAMKRRAEMTCTQEHHAMEGRDLVRVQQVGARPHGSSGPHEAAGHSIALSMYPEKKRERPQWGMVIDLARCIGCNACTIACQAENNIPVVGADQVRRGREMHWIRIDRYFEGELDNPAVYHQPVPCMHCENAPCELVCPVGATTHSHDGLNEMTYNRCVGTRYCSNNCPYKVRRFNFLQFADLTTPTLAMQRNPNVTVRARGVMEKCTYCVQRIRTADIAARKEGRAIVDGEVVTACQQACPAQAIVFGDIDDEHGKATALRKHPGHYGILEDLNTRPRTTYLPVVRNRNEEKV
jgi:molybdopterin-containing oxidoreductase family iron-sulfur binding subunit